MGKGLLVFIILVFPISSRAPSFAQVNSTANTSGIEQRDQLHREATELLQKGKFEEAAISFTEIVARWPDFCPAYTSLGIAYTRLGKLEEAGRSFLMAVQLNSNSAQAHNNLGANYLERKKPAEAAAEFQKATILEPADTSAWFNLGVCELHMGHGVKAEKALQKAAQLNAKDPQILGRLAEAQFKAGKPKSASTTIDRISEVTGADPNVLLSLAVLLQRNGQTVNASAYFKRAEGSMPEISDRVLTLAGSRIDQGDYQTALSLLEWVKDSKQDSAVWHDLAGYSHFKLNQIEPAMHHLQEAIRLDPSHEDYYLDLGNLLGENNALLAAVAVFESGIRVLPNSIKMRLGLAVAYLLTGNLDRVNQEINTVLADQPTLETAYKILLESYDKGMQWPQMQDAAERLRHLNSANPLGWYYGAKSEYEMGVVINSNLKSALKFIQRALELGPPDLKSYFLLGKILIAEKREEEAVVALQKAIRLSSEDPRPFYVLARLLQRVGRNEEAEEVLGAQKVAKAKQDSSQFRRLFVDVR